MTIPEVHLPAPQVSLPRIPYIIQWAEDTGPRLNFTRRACLVELAKFCSESGECWPATELLAWRLDTDTSTIERCIKDLKRLGLILVERVAVSDDHFRNHCQLAGIQTGWVPKPKDPDQKPTIEEAAFALVAELEAQVEHIQGRTIHPVGEAHKNSRRS